MINRATQNWPTASVNVGTTIPDDLYVWLQDYAKRQDASVSSVIRALITAYRAEVANGKR